MHDLLNVKAVNVFLSSLLKMQNSYFLHHVTSPRYVICVAFYCNYVETRIVLRGENLFDMKCFRPPKIHVKHFSFHEQISEIP